MAFFLSNLFSGAKEQSAGPLLGLGIADAAYYQQNLAPLQQQLLDQALSPGTISKAVAQAKTDAATAAGNTNAQLPQQLAQQGVTMTPAQAANAKKQQALAGGIAEVTAANQARSSAVARQSGILGAG